MPKQSEFGGRDTASGVLPHPEDQMSAADKLRLGYTTGQEISADVPLTKRSWEGLNEPGSSRVDE